MPKANETYLITVDGLVYEVRFEIQSASFITYVDPNFISPAAFEAKGAEKIEEESIRMLKLNIMTKKPGAEEKLGPESNLLFMAHLYSITKTNVRYRGHDVIRQALGVWRSSFLQYVLAQNDEILGEISLPLVYIDKTEIHIWDKDLHLNEMASMEEEIAKHRVSMLHKWMAETIGKVAVAEYHKYFE